MSLWDKSSYLDLTASGLTNATTVEQAYGLTTPQAFSGSITMALVLPRAIDPTALLSGSYAEREAVLNGLTPEQVGALYGADPAQYSALQAYLRATPGVTLVTPNQLVSSAASRTIWINVNSQGFDTLFGTPLQTSEQHFAYWDGTLSPNAHLASLTGLWLRATRPPATIHSGAAVTLTSGPQGVANSGGDGYATPNHVVDTEHKFPNEIAKQYRFPIQAIGSATLPTPTIGLIEPGIGNAVADGQNPTELVQAYRAAAGVEGTGTFTQGSVQTQVAVPADDERSLDVGVIAAAAPNSDIIAYAGGNSTYTAFQEAIWGGGPKPAILSSSFGYGLRPAAGSPFDAAVKELYVDAALNNVTVFGPSGDGGSSAEAATGQPALIAGYASPYVTMVGGTSTSSQAQVEAAGAATTDGGPNVNANVAALLQRAIAGDVAALEVLVAGGVLLRPTDATNVGKLLQTAWNQYHYKASTSTLTASYAENDATGGGVDLNLAEPGFQKNAGIDTQALQVADGITPSAVALRGVPDVSALAGGNTNYTVPGPDLTGMKNTGGTSAATPLWAALAAQIQAVFTDQGLPALGAINDLLYQAAAISPAAFNDVLFGSNTSSYYVDPNGSVTATLPAAADGTHGSKTITPTGIGYSAHPGYDLVSGLGTPNGVLLTRAMTQIAQAQIYNPNALGVADATGQVSAATQALILQPTLSTDFTGTILAAGSAFIPATTGSGLGWSARIGQQVLQSVFDASLGQAIAGQAQAASTQINVTVGQSLGVNIAGADAATVAAAYTSPFGFLNYAVNGQAVTLARPLAVAQTYGGQDNINAIVRIRQETPDQTQLYFYKADDLVGTVDGIRPGEQGYDQAARAHRYHTTTDAIGLAGPGEGKFRQAGIVGVNNGDIIGFMLQDETIGKTAWGLAPENGGSNALWSYGANTWGFDDGSAGGDGYNSLVFQLDFTSNAGTGLLAFDNTPACFVAGTRIATPTGERPIEQLAIGDLVVTAAGRHRPIRWIGRRAYAGPFLAAQPGLHPIRFHPGSLGDGLPHRDLLVSPEHAMLIDGVLVPARCLLDGKQVVQESGLAEVAYLHLELDSHDAVMAEGAASETFADDNSRGIFHNAAEYAALYPDARSTPARFCAERLRDGEELAAVLRRLADRRRSPSFGPLLGRLDNAQPDCIAGWAFDRRNTDAKVRLRVTANAVVLGVVTADLLRPDLQQAGYGDGRLGFVFAPDPALPPGPHTIRVCRDQDGAELGTAILNVQAVPAPRPSAPLPPVPGITLRGHIDEATHTQLRGWAWDPAAPHAPVALQVVANGALVATGTANRFRADLRAAGIGTGWHSFEIDIPGGLSPLTRQTIQIRRTDGTRLPVAPVVLMPVEAFGPELEQAIRQVISAVPPGPDGERVLSFMLSQAERLRSRQDGPASQHEAGKQALIIDERLPRAGTDGGSHALLSHARALQALGFAVSLAAAETTPGQEQAEAMLRQAGITPYAPPVHPAVEAVLRRQAGRFDVVYLHRHGPAARYLGLVRAHQPQAHVIYSVADLHHVRLGRQATLAGDRRLLAESRQLQASEFSAAARADAVITHSAAEATMLRQAVPAARVHCVGWDPGGQPVGVPLARRHGVAFIGSFDHAPNTDAALWLIQDVMPLVWRRNPAITCTLAGSGMPPEVPRLAGPRLIVAGHVEHLPALLAQVRLTVAPLRFGAGLKSKVLDSIAAGVPCALTPVAAEGMPLSRLLQSTVGRSADELAAIILQLHDSAEANRRIAAAGRRLVARHYTEEAIVAGLAAVLERDDVGSDCDRRCG